jgi:nucleotide-binding universal stress UspA family protein
MSDAAPILIAYDGSLAARDAVRQAGQLFGASPALVLTVWEPGLAEFMLAPDPTGMGTTMLPYDPTLMREADRASEDHAKDIAHDGEALARSVGLDAQALAVRDSTADTAAVLAASAAEHGARAIVVGSRGLKGLKSKLLGSTSLGLLGKSSCPVLVVRHPDDHQD